MGLQYTTLKHKVAKYRLSENPRRLGQVKKFTSKPIKNQ